ncbi:hypothetical protein [Calothrix sp. PCC 6303]|uniref:hypothetical protein n=1 Tax=Calothrix sp. PCC 6303 TaxID=1170562 RepID=UPI0002FEF23F|nr:hypothetical protein [Calothrix sp. PCC 6303]
MRSHYVVQARTSFSNKRSHSKPKHQKPSFSPTSERLTSRKLRITTQTTKNRHSHQQTINLWFLSAIALSNQPSKPHFTPNSKTLSVIA